MKPTYLITMLLLLSFTTQMNAQRYIYIEASDDPSNPRDIYPVIMGDTTSNGDRIDVNTIYQLENDKVYITTDRLINKPHWPLRIEAVDLEDLEKKPILTRIPNNAGVRPSILFPEGDVHLRNLWIIPGERGPLETPQWGTMRLLGTNAKVVVKDCLIEKENGGFLQIRANGIKLYVYDCIFRNGGNRRILQGNGRGIDARNFSLDTLIMKNTIVHNIHDRFFRSQGGTTPHKYIEIDHCTSFNTTGRHGHIQLGRVIDARITNNLFINPIMMGTSPIYTDEQNQPDNDKHKVITLDTLYDNTNLTILNNNIFWTDDVLNYWNSNDTVSAPPVLSELIVQELGAQTNQAFFQEKLELNNVPVSVLPYVIDLYADPTSMDMFDIIVEDSLLDGTIFDSGNLFEFSDFDPCYSPTTLSATGDTEGNAVGAVKNCEDLTTSVYERNTSASFDLHIFPNPANERIYIQFDLKESETINLFLSDIVGKITRIQTNTLLPKGIHRLEWKIPAQIPPGSYIIQLRSDSQIENKKIVVHSP